MKDPEPAKKREHAEHKVLDVDIESLAFGGAGVGKLPDGKVCFIRGTAPGERVRVEITDERNSFAYGRLKAVLKPSKKRVTPECPLAINGTDDGFCCPGCSYAHVDYQTELNWKERQLEGFLLRGGLMEKNRLREPEGSPIRYGWRNKIRLSADGKKLGYKAEDNETVLDVPDCPLARKAIRQALEYYRDEEHSRETRHVTFRWTLRNGVVIRGNNQPPGRDYLCEQLGKHGNFFVPENSFFQIHVPMAANLVSAAINRIASSGVDHLLELYCGAGVISIAAAQALSHLNVRGVELDKLAIQAAKLNAKKHGVADRCRYEAGDAEVMFLQTLKSMPLNNTAVLVDPPRCGLTAGLCKKLISSRVGAIIYISCAPDTLRRDLLLLKEGGYEICDAKLFDLFPTTAHFETLTVLRRTVHS